MPIQVIVTMVNGHCNIQFLLPAPLTKPAGAGKFQKNEYQSPSKELKTVICQYNTLTSLSFNDQCPSRIETSQLIC